MSLHVSFDIMIQKSFHNKIFLASLFAISMAYLETSIVVYLRELYYPEGFGFPLKAIPLHILVTEIGREAATILMLFAYAKSIGRNGQEVFAYFAFNFGMWDIWYYLWLKLLINWPESLLEWDILFLIPLPWIGPVLAPVLVSLGLIIAGYIILKFEDKKIKVSLRRTDWLLEVIAGGIIIASFLTNATVYEANFTPETYNWWLFFTGFAPGMSLFVLRALKSNLKR
jgi:hypothetical protein